MISGETMVWVSLGEIASGFGFLVGVLWVFLRVLVWQWRRELDLRFAAEAEKRVDRQAEIDRRFVTLDHHIQEEPEHWADIYGRLNRLDERSARMEGQFEGVQEALKPVREQLGRINQYLLDKEG
jgi:hypothetical protein